MEPDYLKNPNANLLSLAKFARSEEEKVAVGNLPVRIINFKRGDSLVHQGDKPTRCFGVLSGFCCSFKITGPGDRQMIALHLTGDMPDLLSLHLTTLDFGVSALSPCSVAFIPHKALHDLCETFPQLAAALWRMSLVEAAIGRECIANNGRRKSLVRVAHVLCEVFTRLSVMGLTDGLSCDFPLTNTDLADATGLSIVHISRCRSELRSLGLAQFNSGKLNILDWERLREVGDFDPTYLQV